MKVYMGKYPRSPVSTFKLFKKYIKWSHPEKAWWDVDEKDYTKRDVVVTKTLDFIDNVVLWPVNFAMKRLHKERKIKVRIDPYDLWNADHTLAQIIHPILVGLKESKHGTPWTERKDAPKGKKYDDYSIEEERNKGYNSARWEYILDEMIFTFSMLKEGDWDFKIYEKYDGWTDEAFAEREKTQKRIQNGLRLFGRYYQALWD